MSFEESSGEESVVPEKPDQAEPQERSEQPETVKEPGKQKKPALPARKGSLLLPGILCLLLVAVEDIFFYGHPWGWTAGCYGLALLCALFLSDRSLPHSRPTLLLFAALAALFLSCFEEPSGLTVFLGLLGLVVLGLTLRDGWSGSCRIWLLRLKDFLLTGWFLIFIDFFSSKDRGSAGRSGGKRTVRFVGNWFIPVGFGLLFLALFAAANPIISGWLEKSMKKVELFLDNLPGLDRFLIWVIVAIWAWALLQGRTGIRGNSMEEAPRKKRIAGKEPAPAFFVRCLGLFNVIFAVQTVLDVTYLWGGASLPEGMTWAEYAHRGAYPLVAAALLAAFFVLMTFRDGPPRESLKWARRLVYIWLAQNLFLVFSAGWRLSLYIEVYTLTRLRIAAMIWMLLVACGLVYIIIRIVRGRTNLWLVNVNAATALIVLYACCFANFDGLIAEYNTSHCCELQGKGPEIDLGYLESLGPETLPALLRLERALIDRPKGKHVRATIARLKKSLDDDLADWRGWTYRRQRLSRLEFPWKRDSTE